MSLYVNRVRYKGGSPTLGASSGIINKAIVNGVDFYDDDYNPTPPAHDYSQDYFTVEPIDGGNITLQFAKSGSPSSFSVYYSTDVVNWSSMTQANTVTLTGKVYLRANPNYGWGSSDTKYWKFNIPQDYKVYGNIMSLLHGSDFLNQTSTKGTYAFYGLFEGSTHLVDAENLVLPATALADNCYAYMFMGCTSLTTAPKALPATTLKPYCYLDMFYNCTSLTTAPELPATTLTNYCYQEMFYGCTSLTTAPELPATTLAKYCYNSMFKGCTSLTEAPELSVTTLANGCYQYMFQNCTSLTTAPELLATLLQPYCYNNMFRGCTSLNKVTCLATNILAMSGSGSLTNWLYGVSLNGTFIKDPSTYISNRSWVSGANGIPTGWTVQDYVA